MNSYIAFRIYIYIYIHVRVYINQLLIISLFYDQICKQNIKDIHLNVIVSFWMNVTLSIQCLIEIDGLLIINVKHQGGNKFTKDYRKSCTFLECLGTVSRHAM